MDVGCLSSDGDDDDKLYAECGYQWFRIRDCDQFAGGNFLRYNMQYNLCDRNISHADGHAQLKLHVCRMERVVHGHRSLHDQHDQQCFRFSHV